MPRRRAPDGRSNSSVRRLSRYRDRSTELVVQGGARARHADNQDLQSASEPAARPAKKSTVKLVIVRLMKAVRGPCRRSTCRGPIQRLYRCSPATSCGTSPTPISPVSRPQPASRPSRGSPTRCREFQRRRRPDPSGAAQCADHPHRPRSDRHLPLLLLKAVQRKPSLYLRPRRAWALLPGLCTADGPLAERAARRRAV